MKPTDKDLNHLVKLLNEWKMIVRSITKGYEFTIYDFENDLAIRLSIEAALDKCTAASQIELLRATDQQFVAATRPRSNAVFEMDLLNRVPLQPGKALKEDIDSLDI